jgi:uncharacterized nucleotidyltransferase DUF6036
MNDRILELLNALDTALAGHAKVGERLDLYNLGRSAMILQHNLLLATKDFDFVQMGSTLETEALRLFGQDTREAQRLGLYLEAVPQGLPPMPHGFRNRCQEVYPGRWHIVRLWRLEDHDFAVTKLKSFRPQVRQDLQYLCDEGLLEPGRLKKSLEEAFIWSHEKDGDKHREKAFANLERVVDYLKGRSRSL